MKRMIKEISYNKIAKKISIRRQDSCSGGGRGKLCQEKKEDWKAKIYEAGSEGGEHQDHNENGRRRDITERGKRRVGIKFSKNY